MEVTEYFNIESGIVVNKADINLEMTEKIENKVKSSKNATYLGDIPYDEQFTEAQMKQQSIIEYAPECKTATKIREIFNQVKKKVYKSDY
ncbi:MAG: MinD/ParA family ATP-binding protein [bacterium]